MCTVPLCEHLKLQKVERNLLIMNDMVLLFSYYSFAGSDGQPGVDA